MQLEGRAAIVTGAGTGVGRATAVGLARRGCAVLVNYSRSREGAEETAEQVKALGVPVLTQRADVSSDADCRQMVAAALESFGRLDVLVNNAGTTRFIPHDQLEDVKTEDWDRILAVNLRGAFQCARAARQALARDGGGEIVNVSSIAGLVGQGSSIPYCASKAALNNLTLTLARVLGPEGIRVNAVAPGFIDGSWLRQGLGPAFDAVRQVMLDRSPMNRVCTPEDVAEAVLSLVTGSDLVTGSILPVEGGSLLAS